MLAEGTLSEARTHSTSHAVSTQEAHTQIQRHLFLNDAITARQLTRGALSRIKKSVTQITNTQNGIRFSLPLLSKGHRKAFVETWILGR